MSEKLTNAEVLSEGLKHFATQEDFTQECIADYIYCPSSDDCSYDGGSNHECCTECKIRWLLSEWEG